MSPEWTNYFTRQVEAIESNGLAKVHSLDEWKAARQEHRRELLDMLGLWPMPERTPLNPVITGTVEHEAFQVEKVHFQAAPKLYVTGNLYIPKKRETDQRLPAILYVCGHSEAVTNGVSLGNKTKYQRHGVWFAQHGYVCLVIDTLQFGEIRGAHRGTYAEGQWWWNSRGYTPAGVEAWFGIRALDYLCSRPEVDPERIGMTGRSGGGAYTWTVAAIDERVKVAAPIAGMTDLRNQVLDGKVDGHCDCMFHVNSHRWDFPMIAALIAPRPLLLGNSDKDRIFPLDGVQRVHGQVRRIYSLYGAQTNLGLVIVEGDHQDVQEIQVPVFRWFNRWLKADDSLIDIAARQAFDGTALRVFDELPGDERNTTVQKWFNLPEPLFARPGTDPGKLQAALRKYSFAGWPADQPEGNLRSIAARESKEAVQMTTYELPVQDGTSRKLYVVLERAAQRPKKVTLFIPDQAQGERLFGLIRKGNLNSVAEELKQLAPKAGNQVAILEARGINDPAFATKASETRMRRRLMLVGQTLDSLRVWDIRCAIKALRVAAGNHDQELALRASGPMAVNAAFAALFDPADKLELSDMPAGIESRPDYLNVLKVTSEVPAP